MTSFHSDYFHKKIIISHCLDLKRRTVCFLSSGRFDSKDLRCTFLRLLSLLSAHSFLVLLPHWIDPRHTFSLLTSEKKILLFVVVWVVLVEDIRAVTMLYALPLRYSLDLLFSQCFLLLERFQSDTFSAPPWDSMTIYWTGSTMETNHSLQSPHSYLSSRVII